MGGRNRGGGLTPEQAELARRIVRAATRPRLDWSHLPVALAPPGLADTGFWVACPNGHRLHVPVNLSNVQMEGARNNLLLTCGVCDVSFDAAPSSTPGGRVRVDTSGGRLTVKQLARGAKGFARALRGASVAELHSLQEALATVSVDAAAGDVAETVIAAAPTLREWVEANPAVTAVLATLLGSVLGAIISTLLTIALQREHEPATPVEVDVDVRLIDPDAQEVDEDRIEELVRRELDAADRPGRQRQDSTSNPDTKP